jgi:addiction module HigA family antidote
VIVSFRDKRTADFAAGKRVKAFAGIERSARLKLDRLEAANSLRDLVATRRLIMPVTVIRPGEQLAEELNALDMSAAELARKLRVPTNRVTQILNGTRSITGDAALRLAHFFGSSAQFWLNLQSLYDLRLAEQKAGKSIKTLPTLKRQDSASA